MRRSLLSANDRSQTHSRRSCRSPLYRGLPPPFFNERACKAHTPRNRRDFLRDHRWSMKASALRPKRSVHRRFRHSCLGTADSPASKRSQCAVTGYGFPPPRAMSSETEAVKASPLFRKRWLLDAFSGSLLQVAALPRSARVASVAQWVPSYMQGKDSLLIESCRLNELGFSSTAYGSFHWTRPHGQVNCAACHANVHLCSGVGTKAVLYASLSGGGFYRSASTPRVTAKSPENHCARETPPPP